MTLAEARACKKGDHIASPHDDPPWRVRRVTRKWANEDDPLFRVQLGRAEAWYPLKSFEKAPKGYYVGQVIRDEDLPCLQTRETAEAE